MIDAMGIGLILPVMPDLIEEVHGGTLAQAAVWGGILSAGFAVMQFLFGPAVGNLSDSIGRRPVLLVSLFVLAIDYLVMAVAGSIWLLLAGRVLGGIFSATHSTASAYMADISKPHEKAANFGLIGGAFGMGFVLGPLIGGFLGEYGTRAPFYAAAALAAFNGCVGIFVLRETVGDRIRRPFTWKRSNPFGAFRYMALLPGIGALLAVTFLYQVAFSAYPAVWSYFTQARFDWTPQVIGLSLGLFGVTMALVQGGLIRIALRRWGERQTVINGHLFEVCAFAAVALVPSGLGLLLLTPLAALGAIITPALQGIMSQRVGDDEQGALQGVLVSTNALAMIVSPLMMTWIFALFTRAEGAVHFPGAPFVLSMILVIAGLVVFLRAEPAVTSRH